MKIYYIETDHLGSILALFDSQSGQKTYAQSFDAWGRERNPQTWDYTSNTTTKPEWLIRGYTGHEHLPEFGLINMNGRMYDPVLGRMLSPDNFVQDPSSSQSYNRYSYCWNNPLKYTDPSGEIVWMPIIIGAVMGTYLGSSVANDNFNPAQWDFNSSKTYIGMGIGMVVGGYGGHKIGLGLEAETISGSKLAANSYAGTLNAVYNYDSDQSGLATLGYFGAGYFGSSMAIGDDNAAAIFAGGTANVLVGIAAGDVTDEYTFTQHFVGGALSAFAGKSFFKSISGLSSTAAKKGYSFGEYGDKFVSYGIQANAFDFAYTSKESYAKKDFGQHFGTFIMGGLGGVMQGKAMSGSIETPSNLGDIGVAFGLSAIAYGIEYAGASHIKANYYGLSTKGWQTKVGTSVFKALMYSLMIK